MVEAEPSIPIWCSLEVRPSRSFKSSEVRSPLQYMVHKHDDNNMDVWIHDNPCRFVGFICFIAVWVWVYWRFLSTHQLKAWHGQAEFEEAYFVSAQQFRPNKNQLSRGHLRPEKDGPKLLSQTQLLGSHDAVVATRWWLLFERYATFGSGYHAVWEVNGWRPLRSWLGLGQRPWNLKGRNWKPMSWKWWLSSVCPSSWGSLHFTVPPYQIRFVILSMLRFKVQRASWIMTVSRIKLSKKTQMAWGILTFTTHSFFCHPFQRWRGIWGQVEAGRAIQNSKRVPVVRWRSTVQYMGMGQYLWKYHF